MSVRSDEPLPENIALEAPEFSEAELDELTVSVFARHPDLAAAPEGTRAG